MTILTVGPSQQFATLTAAVQAAHSGDSINLLAGTYINDFPPPITQNLIISGIGGMAHLLATIAPPNGKAILITGSGMPASTLTINNLEFSNVTVADANGAGIRYEGGHLILNGCYFHDNQDGILGGSDPTIGAIDINNCEFANNGAGDGRSHNIYVMVHDLTLRNVYSRSALAGHGLKSRASSTWVINSRFQDENGNGSYCMDFPNGGNVTITGSIVQKGSNSQNSTCLIAYGEEGSVRASSSLTVTANTLINDRAALHEAIWNTTSVAAQVQNNATWNVATMLVGPGAVSGTTVLPVEPVLNTGHPWQNPVAPPAPLMTKAIILAEIAQMQTLLAKLVTDIGLL